MKKGISISLLALFLTACGGSGGGSSSDNKPSNASENKPADVSENEPADASENEPTSNDDNNSNDSNNNTNQNIINREFASGIKGADQEPALTLVEVSDGDTVSLNTTLKGSIAEDGILRLSFIPTESKTIALILSSAAEDFDLSVSSTSTNLDSTGDNSDEALIFEVTAEQLYSISVDSFEGNGDFQLKLVDANRSSFGLSSNEYIITANYNNTQVCVENDRTDTHVSNYLVHTTINWKDGYAADLFREEKLSFTSVQENSFTIVNSSSSMDEDGTSDTNLTLNYTTNFETGLLTGTLVSKQTFIEKDGDTEICNSDIKITAKVAL